MKRMVCICDNLIIRISPKSKKFTNQPLPAPRSCACSPCTNETCGDSWSGLTYCNLDDGLSSTTPATCASQCYPNNNDGVSICTNQLIGEPIQCGSTTCRTTSCGTTSCDESTETCAHTCSTGCCKSLDSTSCQPCTSGGNLIFLTNTIDGIPVWAIALIALGVAALIVTAIVVVIRLRSGGITDATLNKDLIDKF